MGRFIHTIGTYIYSEQSLKRPGATVYRLEWFTPMCVHHFNVCFTVENCLQRANKDLLAGAMAVAVAIKFLTDL